MQGFKHSEETKLKMSESRKGRKFSKKHRESMSKAMKKRWESPEYRSKLKESMRSAWRDPNIRSKMIAADKRSWEICREKRMKTFHSASHRKRQSDNAKKLWKDLEYRKRVITNTCKSQAKRPNIPEKKVAKLLPKSFLYTGNGKAIIDKFVPDFVDEEKKLIVEMFGDYWHTRPRVRERDKERLKAFHAAGYKTLIIWEHELESSLAEERVNEFMREAD